MINFRFHLVSLVAIFLALGLGVAMGASFIDRATVETLRGRLDQLESNYRDRGSEIDGLRSQLTAVDRANEEMLDDGSAVLAGRLEGRAVVLIEPEGISGPASDAAWQALASAGAERVGTLTVEGRIALEDEASLGAARDLVGLDSASPGLVRGRLLSQLADALATLTATAPQDTAPPAEAPAPGAAPVEGAPAGGPSEPVPTTVAPANTAGEFRPLGPSPTVEELEAARSFIESVIAAGFLSVQDAQAATPFPAVDEVTYVVLVERGADESAVAGVRRLAGAIAGAAPATVTVAETEAPREPGALPDSDPVPSGTLLGELRGDGDLVDRLSTVDHLEEAIGRLALVLAVEEQFSGSVGHYGIGPGATATLPSADG
jgi:hypothetical protein